MQSFTFNSDNLKLDGALFYPPIKKVKHPAILFVHGWTSAKERSFQYAEALADLGYICLLFDMRGHGTSEGDINASTFKDFLEDVMSAYDYLLGTSGVNPENISSVGSSFGGYLVALLSSKRKVKNLVLRVPADYPNESFNDLKKLYSGDDPEAVNWRNQSRKSTETYALEALNNFKGDILIIESEKDDTVPHQTIVNYINAVKDKNRLTHIVMKDAPHSLKEGKFRDEVGRILAKWFQNKS
ncbi:MAG: alpha/beta fold hydrolase [Candidatus Curtissbacteria bacterium]|nr:alpha/beta fold hydrolase [Candidatus Curtissbacteria bacterium]